MTKGYVSQGYAAHQVLVQARTEARRTALRLEAAPVVACGNEPRPFSPLTPLAELYPALIPAPTYSQALYDYALGMGVRMATAPESVRATAERSFRQYADKFSDAFPAPIWY